MLKKNHLLTPGPTPIPERVQAIFTLPIPHHRTPAFQALFGEVKQGLQDLFQTKQDVILLTCTGTGAMEAAVSNLFSPAEKIIVVDAGKFGERWGKIAAAFGLKPVMIRVERGDAVDPSEVERAAKANPDARAICFTASETATGALMPTRELAEIAKRHKMLSVCDAITALGVFDLPMDAWGIDCLITGSQKALMIPPGMAFIALSDKGWDAVETSQLPRFYFDLARERKAHAKGQTAWSPATTLIQGLHESLKMLNEEGIPNVYRRHETLARATRAAVHALGLELLAKNAPSPAVTAIKVPSQIKDGKAIVRTMRDDYGVLIAGGQDELEGKIFRLSHFGYVDEFDITTAISCLELTLHKLGYPVKFGSGVGAALKIFAEERSK